MFSFLSKSIKFKIIALVTFVLFFSQVISFFVTFINIRKSQERNLEDSFSKAQQVINTLVEAQKKNLDNQSELIGSLPILSAVVDSGDEETIIDTLKEYQKSLSIKYVDIFDSDGDYLVGSEEVSDQFQEKTGKILADKALEGEHLPGFFLRDGKLTITAANSIGASQVGALVLGNSIDDSFSLKIQELTGVDASFISEEKIIATSLNESVQNDLLATLKNHDEDSFKTQSNLYKVIWIKNYTDKVIGKLVLQASLQASNQFFINLILIILGIMFGVFIFLQFIGVRFSKNITGPILKLKDSAGEIVSTLNYKIRAEVTGEDEVSALAQMFNRLLDEIQKNHKELEEYSENLEKKVEERTIELKSSRDRTATLLNNLDQGFMVFCSDGMIEEGSSLAASKLFAIDPKGKRLSDVLHAEDEEGHAKIQRWVDLMFEESFLDFDSLAAIGPSEFRKVDDRFIKLEYRPIFHEGTEKVMKVICIASDKTEEEMFKQLAEKEKATVNLVISALDDRGAFIDFVKEGKRIISDLKKHLNEDEEKIDVDYLFRYLHTIKGGCSSFHFLEVALIAHEVENFIVELKGKPREELIKSVGMLKEKTIEIETSFEGTLAEHKNILGDVNSEADAEKTFNMEEVKSIYLRLKQELSENSPALVAYEKAYLLDDLALAFNRYRKTVIDVAEKQDKKVDFFVEPSEVFVDIEKYKSLIASTVHIFRNAVDHGIEDSATREMCGKTANASIKVRCESQGEHITIKVEDDGQGIDAATIARLAVEKEVKSEDEIKSMSEEEIVQLIFAAGFSTKAEVSDLSGRGVGLDSVKYEAEGLGGSVFVKTNPGEGSSFEIKLPR